MRQFFLFLALISPFFINAQKLKKAEKAQLEYMTAQVQHLASDDLEGRRAGTDAEKKAAAYIQQQFQQNGITKTSIQNFDIYDGKKVDATSFFYIDEQELKLNSDFFPFPFTKATENIEALVSPALLEPNSTWIVDLGEIVKNETLHPHFDYMNAVKNYADQLAEKGVKAVIVYNKSKEIADLSFSAQDRTPVSKIPVIYVTKAAANKYLADPEQVYNLHFKAKVSDQYRTSQNVIAYLDRGAAKTIVVGAHYDHLGYGEDGNSTDRSGVKAIHNGADDNASGTAVLLQLSKSVQTFKTKDVNYLFIAFGAEELGLLGSKHYADNPTLNLSNVKFMINLDMVGRMKENQFTIGGFGTSPYWSTLFNQPNFLSDYKVNFDTSGVGPSDHTSFYRKNIPVLFFFTGSHTDYHKPSDDADKINYLGMLKITQLLEKVLSKGETATEIAFQATKEPTMGTRKFNVTLGVMPDYSYSGVGVKIDGVTEGRPGAKAGIKAGDIILKIGDIATNSMDGYMNALGSFEKGQSTIVIVKRGEEEIKLPIEF
ncbi:M28 family peptidase [Gynurincola endophyticus]|uniref:M28 family peptidase n=1 Tax=Gynurincola endophyticus TaxID=2479004 RepID=UPI000F8EF344|nr:M28 family peptidase [Gynurincola endophyticus]